VYEIPGLPVPYNSAALRFGTTETILGYDTGISSVGSYGSDYIELTDWPPGHSKKGKTLVFDGDDAVYLDNHWTDLGFSWYSGNADLRNDLIFGQAYVNPTDPTLAVTTYWDLEDYWDFGFVQVSTDDGVTWISLANEHTTYDHDPNAHPNVLDNLPGLTGWSGGVVDMTFDLGDYAGENVLIGFRYVSDWVFTYEGWYVLAASVSDTEVGLTPWIESLEIDFQVSVIWKLGGTQHTQYVVWDMTLDDVSETGEIKIPVSKHHSVFVVVSPMMEAGFADYQFGV
jgi:hypothetical protein